MKGHAHVPTRRHLTLAAITALLATTLPATVNANGVDPAELPRCAELGAAGTGNGEVVRPWAVELDDEGEVRGHHLVLRRDGQDVRLRTGRRGFSSPAGPDRLLVGEREGGGTRLHMIDTDRGCRTWTRSLTRLLYLEREGAGGGKLRFSAIDPATRTSRGRLLVNAETGDSGGLIDDECIETCTPNDGDVSLVALAAAGPARPVPNFSAGGWPKNKTLSFRWRAGGAPPSWAAGAMKNAAADATGSSDARSPKFVYRSDATNAIGYTGSVPGYCGINGIACAGRAMPSTWGVWLRPHGTDYAWGTLRWCQRNSASKSCFDIRRVTLHELGHIAGLNHPSNAGFTLAAKETVMQAITPARPKTGASRHSFGRCDVATLQELYDTPDNRTAISTCNDVATKVTLSTSKASVSPGGSVKLKAQLRIDSRSAYRQLSGNYLNARSLKLKYRRAGSEDSWKTLWMKPTYASGRYELSLSPDATWEYKAVFPEPADEGLRYSRSTIVKVKVKD